MGAFAPINFWDKIDFNQIHKFWWFGEIFGQYYKMILKVQLSLKGKLGIGPPMFKFKSYTFFLSF